MRLAEPLELAQPARHNSRDAIFRPKRTSSGRPRAMAAAFRPRGLPAPSAACCRRARRRTRREQSNPTRPPRASACRATLATPAAGVSAVPAWRSSSARRASPMSRSRRRGSFSSSRFPPFAETCHWPVCVGYVRRITWDCPSSPRCSRCSRRAGRNGRQRRPVHGARAGARTARCSRSISSSRNVGRDLLRRATGDEHHGDGDAAGDVHARLMGGRSRS